MDLIYKYAYMANIKFSKVLKNAYPLHRLQTIVDYYHLTSRKNSRKYLDEFNTHWEQKWVAVEILNLIKQDRKHILDVGAGIGLFAWICMTLGHKVDVTELPVKNQYQPSDIINFFDDVKKACGLESVTTYRWEISSTDCKFPSEKQYDLITMQRTNFDIGWSEQDYTKWIKTCLWKGLLPNGKVFWVCPKTQRKILEMACKREDIRYKRHLSGKENYIFELHK